MYEEQRVRRLSQGPGGFSKALLTPPTALKHQYKRKICSLGIRSSVWGQRGVDTHGRSGRMKMDFSPPIFSLWRSRSPLPFTPTTWRPTGDWAGAVHHGIGSGPRLRRWQRHVLRRLAALEQVAWLPCQPGACANLGNS